jgi:glutaminyl-peptide cyclotransferase
MVRWIAATALLAGCMGAHNDREEQRDNNDGRDQVPALPKNLPKPAAFDGARAMGYLKAVCAIGPRMSGTEGMRKQQQLLRKHFEDLGLKVTMQNFRAKQVTVKDEINMTNMIVCFAPEKTKRVILCSHYDTRPIADQEDDPRKWREPFVSANDGGSGVALLMELANHFKNLKIDVGVDLVFFDGEEFIWDSKKDRYFIGSEHFAQSWIRSKARPDYVGAILLDMVGGKDAKFPQEFHSRQFSGDLCQSVWRLAKTLKMSAFKDEHGHTVLDDHLELQKVGIPAIDIIDFDYTHWHKLSDTPEQCSAESLTQVATVLSVWIQIAK